MAQNANINSKFKRDTNFYIGIFRETCPPVKEVHLAVILYNNGYKRIVFMPVTTLLIVFSCNELIKSMD